jgi:hypothetical protein
MKFALSFLTAKPSPAQGYDLRSNVMAKVPETFFNPAGIHHVHPA